MQEMALRSTNLARLDDGYFDVLIVGGGINGAVVAAALAGRGARVALVDRGDFGAQTSQESSNLVWGGFKYLENFEFRLVSKLCRSRNRLMRAYPDNVREIGFLASLGASSPYSPRFAWLGAMVYWAIGGCRTRRPKYVAQRRLVDEEPVVRVEGVRGAVEYNDAYLVDNDARFVFSFVRSAVEAGAVVANYVEVIGAEYVDGTWSVELVDVDDEAGGSFFANAKVVVNAAGPFADGLNTVLGVRTRHRIVHSKGVHLVVPRLTKGRSDRVLAFFDDTKRLFYVIPMGSRSVVGTTDTRVATPESDVTDEDVDFLLGQINARIRPERPLTCDDVIARRCGVRPLVVRTDEGDRNDEEWTTLSRKHEIEADRERAVVTVFGGKLTDCLNVGEEVAAEVSRLGIDLEPDSGEWFGEPASATRDEFFRQARLMRLDALRERPGTEPLTERLWRRYGHRAFAMLDAIREDPSMGEDVLEHADYLRVELHLAANTEMITRFEDFMRRRSKIDQVVPADLLDGNPGLEEMARILFGEDAERRLDEYVNALTGPRRRSS
jgi:glycerol-3-phosphate dehydrogenase